MNGLDGLADVQARIAAIQAQFAPPAIGPLGSGASTSSAVGSGGSSGGTSDFASVLSGVGANSSGSPTTDPSALATGPTPGAIPADGDMRSKAAREQFARDVLTRIGAPVTADNVRAMVAWQMAEGTRASFNPLATVRSSNQPGESQFNSVGVKNFGSYQAGVDTTVGALENGLYGNIIAALQRGNDAQGVAQAVANSRWGTGQGVLRVLASGSV